MFKVQNRSPRRDFPLTVRVYGKHYVITSKIIKIISSIETVVLAPQNGSGMFQKLSEFHPPGKSWSKKNKENKKLYFSQNKSF
jgi:hypothetical protein